MASPQTGVALLKRAVAIAPLDLGVKRNLIAVLWDAQLYAVAPGVSRTIGPDRRVPRLPRTSSRPEPSTSSRAKARFDVADSAQRHRCHGATDDDSCRGSRSCFTSLPGRCEIVDRVRRRLQRKVCWIWQRARGAGLYAGGERRDSGRINGINLSCKLELIGRPSTTSGACRSWPLRGHEAVLRLEPEHAQALNNFGAALVTVGRHDDAVKVLEKCLDVEPGPGRALTNLAHWANEGYLERCSLLNNRAIGSTCSETRGGPRGCLRARPSPSGPSWKTLPRCAPRA